MTNAMTRFYAVTADSTMSYLESLYKRYGYKVWLTEFSCGDGAAARPTADHVKFMQAILPRLVRFPLPLAFAFLLLSCMLCTRITKNGAR
jgi:hypothetical protein